MLYFRTGCSQVRRATCGRADVLTCDVRTCHVPVRMLFVAPEQVGTSHVARPARPARRTWHVRHVRHVRTSARPHVRTSHVRTSARPRPARPHVRTSARFSTSLSWVHSSPVAPRSGCPSACHPGQVQTRPVRRSRRRGRRCRSRRSSNLRGIPWPPRRAHR